MLQGLRVAVDRRLSQVDRRRHPRVGALGRRRGDRARAMTAAVVVLLASAPAAAAAEDTVEFGVDAKGAARARKLGIPVAYGSAWAGAWNQKSGWSGVQGDLHAARAAGVDAVVHWWYWGDDISPPCVEQGCRDRYHGVQKNRETWTRLSHELADLIVDVMGPDSGAIVIVETEFNKNGIERHEAFDGYLAEQAGIFHSRGLRVVIGFGNWGRSEWKRFDRAVAAADMIGAMALQSSIRDETTYLSGANMLLDAARYNQAVFRKPTFVTDFAFSSYPQPAYELYQDTVIREIFARMDDLRAAGVRGMVWRMLADDPKFDTNNYHGQAERHWGLVRADGSEKPAFQSFVNGVVAEARLTQAAPASSARQARR